MIHRSCAQGSCALAARLCAKRAEPGAWSANKNTGAEPWRAALLDIGPFDT